MTSFFFYIRNLSFLVLFFTYLKLFPQKTIFDSIVNFYNKQSFYYSVEREYFSALNKGSHKQVANVYYYRENGIMYYKIDCESRCEEVKNSKFYGCNIYNEKRFENFRTNEEHTIVETIGFKPNYVFSPDSFVSWMSNSKRRIIDRVNLPTEYIIMEKADTSKIYSKDEILVPKRLVFKYHISKVDYRITKVVRDFSYVISDVGMNDSAVFIFNYKKKSYREIISEINRFVPFKDTLKKKEYADHVRDTITSFPEFSLKDTSLSVFNSSDIKPRYVLVEFWYKSCGPCLGNMKRLEKVRKHFSSADLEIIALNETDSIDRNVKTLIQKLNLSFKFLFGNKSVTKQLVVKSYPTSYVYDNSTKKILLNHLGTGLNYAEEMINSIERIIGK